MEYDSRQRNAILPPIMCSDMDLIKREETEYKRKYSTINMQTATIINPPLPYPRPPLPYGFPPFVSSSAPYSTALHPPLPGRPNSGIEEESSNMEPKSRQSCQSLPSIHEALGTSESLIYPSQQVVSAPVVQPYLSAPAPPSPSSKTNVYLESHKQNFDRSLSRAVPHTSQRTQHTQQIHTSQPLLAHPVTTPTLSASTVYHSRSPRLQPIVASQSPRPGLRQNFPQPWQIPAAVLDDRASQQNLSSHAYPQPQLQSIHMPPPLSKNAANLVPPPTLYPTAPSPIPAWRNTGPESRPAEGAKKSSQQYGESVKRHLDVFDLESSLNQISDSSRHLLEFSTHYRQRAHDTQRSGHLPGTMPHLNEIDDKMQHANQIQDSLGRIREVLHAQQAALAERSREQMQKVANGYISEDGESQQGDGKGGGFAGQDPKKRRARAAPPGRCHSCNRAETPEWRRGPDGARTLCNACGLHYAKLTRKMGATKNAIGNSSLRPKSLGPGSPTM